MILDEIPYGFDPVNVQESDVEKMLGGYGPILANFFFKMPDYPLVLNVLTLRDLDQAPDFPWLFGMIGYWHDKLDGALHSVSYTHETKIASGEWQQVTGELYV